MYILLLLCCIGGACRNIFNPLPLHLVIGVANNKNKKHNNINCTDFLLLFIELEQFSLFFLGMILCCVCHCYRLFSFFFVVVLFSFGGGEVEGRLNKYSHV